MVYPIMIICLHVLSPFYSLIIELVHFNILKYNPSAGSRLDNLAPPTHKDLEEEYMVLPFLNWVLRF